MGTSNRFYTTDLLEHAAKTLDLPTSLDFSSNEINAQWKKLMGRVHPDVGGSNYFAEQLNGARDLLLDWIKSGRAIDTGSGGSTEVQQDRTRVQEEHPSTKPPKSGRSKVGRILGWLLLLGFLSRIILNLIGSTDYEWHFSSKFIDGSQIDAAFKNIPSSGGLQVDLYCISKPSETSKVIALSVAETMTDASIVDVDYGRSDNFKAEKADNVTTKEAVLHAVKVIDTMTQAEKVDQFGISGVILITKWLLSQNSKAEISEDVKNLVLNYYGAILFRGKMHLIVTVRRNGNDVKYEGDVDLNYPDNMAQKVFGSCNMRYPLIAGN